MNRRSIVLLAVAAVLVVAVIYAIVPKGHDGAPPPLQKIRIVDGLTVNSIHVLIADKKGFFREEGLDVEVSYSALGKFAMDALNAGSVEYSGCVEMNVAQSLFKDKDYAILCEFAEPITGIKVLGRKDKGVAKAADLRGKKIGVFYGVNIHVFIQKVLEDAGIPVTEVTLVNLSPPDAAAAFISGSIDAVIMWQPIINNIQKKVGDKLVLITEDDAKYWPYKLILATKRTYLDSHREEAAKVLRAMIKADDFIAKHPDEVYLIVAKHLQVDPELMPSFCQEIHYEIRLTQRLIDMIAYEVEWLPKHLPTFYADKQPVTTDFRALVADVLKEIKPSAYKME